MVKHFKPWLVCGSNIHIQVLQTDMHTFPYTISWENWIKDQGIFPVVIILIIPITFPLNYVLKMLRGNWWLSLMPTEHYWLILFAFFLILSLGFWHGQFVHLSNKVKNIISSRCHEHKPHNTMHRQSSPRRDCLFGRGARAHFPNSGW